MKVAVGVGETVDVAVGVIVGVTEGVGVLLAVQRPFKVQLSGILDHPVTDHVPSVTAPLNEIVTDPIEPVPPVILPFVRVN